MESVLLNSLHLRQTWAGLRQPHPTHLLQGLGVSLADASNVRKKKNPSPVLLFANSPRVFVNGFIHRLPERAASANGRLASSASQPIVICSLWLCHSDWAPRRHMMWPLLLDTPWCLALLSRHHTAIAAEQPWLLDGAALHVWV